MTSRLDVVLNAREPGPYRITFEEAVKLLTDYHEARARETKKLKGRIALHLTPLFGGKRLMATITSDTIVADIAHRQNATRSPQR